MMLARSSLGVVSTARRLCAVSAPRAVRLQGSRFQATGGLKCWLSTDTKKQEGEEDKAAAAAEAAGDHEEAKEAPAEEPPSELEVAKSDLADMKNRWMRALADTENTRTIAKRDVKQARDYAVSKFAKSLLDVSDSLSLGLKAAAEKPDDVKILIEGITMTKDSLKKAFNVNGLAEYGEEGEKFDPSLHEALYEFDDPTKEVGAIGMLMKSGFKLNGRVIRAAQCGIVKARPEDAPKA